MNSETETLLREHCPAAFATAPRSDVSNRYMFVPTLPIVERLLDLGWKVNSAHQRKDDITACHRITFGLPDTAGLRHIGQYRPTAHIINSHDRSHRLQFSAGLEVCACDNQLHYTVEGLDDAVDRIHIFGEGEPNLDDVVHRLLNAQGATVHTINRLLQRHLSFPESLRFAQRALMHYRNAIDPMFVRAADAEPLLTPRRVSDFGDDAWTTLNVVQENLIERGRTGRGGVHEILRNHALNVALWQEAQALLN